MRDSSSRSVSRSIRNFEEYDAKNIIWVGADEAWTEVETRGWKIARDVAELHREAIEVRLRLLQRLTANHDNEGAAAPVSESFESAAEFLRSMSTAHRYTVTLNDEGLAVIELEDAATGFQGEITFLGDGTLECYCRPTRGAKSEMLAGSRGSEGFEDFLSDRLGVFA